LDGVPYGDQFPPQLAGGGDAQLLPAIFVYFLFRPCELVFFIACAETNFSGNAP
jgi:hypothetical protein